MAESIAMRKQNQCIYGTRQPLKLWFQAVLLELPDFTGVIEITILISGQLSDVAVYCYPEMEGIVGHVDIPPFSAAIGGMRVILWIIVHS